VFPPKVKSEKMASSSSSFKGTLAAQLRLVGNGLLNAPSSVDELLTLLDVCCLDLPIHAYNDLLRCEALLALGILICFSSG